MTLGPSSPHSRSSSSLAPSVSRDVDGEAVYSERGGNAERQQAPSIKNNKLNTTTTTTTSTQDNKRGLPEQISQQPLPAVVARRAFECVVDARGVMSQVLLHLTKEEEAVANKRNFYGDHDDGVEAISTVGRGHSPPPPSARGGLDVRTLRTDNNSLEPLRFGAEFDLGDPQVGIVYMV